MIIADTETTGIDKPSFALLEEQPAIIELAFIEVSASGEIIGSFEEVFDPCQPLPTDPKWLKKFPWRAEDFVGKRKFRDAASEISKRLSFHVAFAGHNALFDRDMIRYECDRAGVAYLLPPDILDTSAEFRHLFGFNPHLPQLYERVLGKPITSHHRAMADVMSVYEILKGVGWWTK